MSTRRPEKKMSLQSAMRRLGCANTAQLARRLGVSRAAVAQWRVTEIPELQRLRILYEPPDADPEP